MPADIQILVVGKEPYLTDSVVQQLEFKFDFSIQSVLSFEFNEKKEQFNPDLVIIANFNLLVITPQDVIDAYPAAHCIILVDDFTRDGARKLNITMVEKPRKPEILWAAVDKALTVRK